MAYKGFHDANESRDSILHIDIHEFWVGKSSSDSEAAQTEQLNILIINIVALEKTEQSLSV